MTISFGTFKGITDIANATGSTSTTSTSYILVPGMTITPPAGNYLVWFSSYGTHQSNNQELLVSLYSGGAQVIGSERGVNVRDDWVGIATHGQVVVDGSQAIEARWRSTNGTIMVFDRTLAILQV
jgi:hypothetical protein